VVAEDAGGLGVGDADGCEQVVPDGPRRWIGVAGVTVIELQLERAALVKVVELGEVVSGREVVVAIERGGAAVDKIVREADGDGRRAAFAVTGPAARCGGGVSVPTARPQILSPHPTTVPLLLRAKLNSPAATATASSRTFPAIVTTPTASDFSITTTRPFEPGYEGIPVACPEMFTPHPTISPPEDTSRNKINRINTDNCPMRFINRVNRIACCAAKFCGFTCSGQSTI
jgi:hypothetical protein